MKRLSEIDPDGLESQLIRAGQREAPAATLQQAAAAAGSLALAGALAPRAVAASGGAKALLLLAAKGMLAGAIVTGTVVAFTQPQQPPAVASEPPRLPALVPPKGEESPAVSPALPAVPAEEVTETASSTRTPAKRAPGPPRATEDKAPLAQVAPTNSVATVQHPRFTEELRAFEGAHTAFTRGDLSSAETALGNYLRDFPGGALALEADVLRIELLHARGNAPALRTRARSFLTAHPTAPAARRVRKLLEQSEGTSP
jgi:TolA-binding protein